MGREGRNDAAEIARQEKNRWKKRALRAEATLGKVREYVPSLQTNRAQADLRAILDESPTERETPADEWVYSVGGRGSGGRVWCDEDEVTPDIDEAREWVEEALESGTFANACLVRRRKQVWEVCDE